MFIQLYESLHSLGHLDETQGVLMEEARGMTLMILGHLMGYRQVADKFQHSIETVRSHFNLTIKAMCRLGQQITQPTHTTGVHPYINSSRKYFL